MCRERAFSEKEKTNDECKESVIIQPHLVQELVTRFGPQKRPPSSSIAHGNMDQAMITKQVYQCI